MRLLSKSDTLKKLLGKSNTYNKDNDEDGNTNDDFCIELPF